MPFQLPGPSGVVASYGDFTFSEYALTTMFDVKVKEDEAGRTASYTEITVEIKDWLIGVIPQDDAVQAALCELKKVGQPFVYQGRGVGNVAINTALGVRDIQYGPHPEGVRVRLLTAVGTEAWGGVNVACEITWRVVLRTAPCCEAVELGAFPMELTWTLDFDTDRNGRCSYAVNGKLRIANHRLLGNPWQVLFSPDDYLDQLVGEPRSGFRREGFRRQLNADRTTMTFSYRDVEFAGEVYPEGCTDASFTQRTRSSGSGLLRWETTLSGRYTIAPGHDSTAGLKAFFALVKDRIDNERAKELNPPLPGTDPLSNGAPTFIPTYFKMSEGDIHENKRVDLTLSFAIAGLPVDTMKETVGHFRRVPDTGADPWETWRASVEKSALAPSGWLDVKWRASADFVQDMCSQQNGQTIELVNEKPDPGEMITELFSVPNRSASWLQFRNFFRVESDSGTVRSRPLPQKPIVQPPKSLLTEDGEWAQPLPSQGNPPPDATGGRSFGAFQDVDATLDTSIIAGGALAASLGGSEAGDGPDDACTVQRQSIPTIKITMFGHAIRAGYEVAIPELIEVDDGKGGKLTPIPCNVEGVNHITKGCIGNYGIPLFGARWELSYYLEKTPRTALNSPDNPMEKAAWKQQSEEVDSPDGDSQ